MRFFKAILVTMFLLIANLTQSVVHAGMSPLTYKNVSKCFNPGYEFYNPIFGCAALISGIIDNLRFYYVYPSIDKDGKRDYILDQAPKDDPVMEIILILFPSPAGQLTTETDAKTNFGRYCTSVQVAALLNFAHAIRAFYQNEKNKATQLPNNITKILTIIGQHQSIEIAFPADPFKNTNKNSLLTAIKKTIEAEIKSQKNNGAPGFYPNYIVEQILNAFFCHKFANQQDIIDLLQKLNDAIVHKTKIGAIQGLLVKEDVASALEKINTSPEKCDLDDIWIICNRDIFDRILPYKSGKAPIQSGNAQLYQRSSNISRKNASFPDCVEITLRHIINFLLYDPIHNRFNMPAVKNTYMQNLYDFYVIQSPNSANAGSDLIRSTWNKVVANLGDGVEYCRKFDTADETNTNELKSGMLNMIRVFKILFSLDLTDEPAYVPGQEDEFKQSAQKWIVDGLEKFCKVLNAHYTSNIVCSNVAFDLMLKEILGDFSIEVKSSSNQKLFSFMIHVLNNHEDIQNLVISKKDKDIIRLNPDDIKTIQNTLVRPSTQSTILPSLLLLDPVLQSAEALALASPLYLVFRETITEGTSLINALKTMQILLNKSLMSRNHAVPIFKNILPSFPWDDQQILTEIMESMNLQELAQSSSDEFTRVLHEEMKSLVLQNDDDAKLIGSFSNIKYLYCSSNSTITNLNLSSCPNLIQLKLPDTLKLETITFPPKMDRLEKIDLQASGIMQLKLPLCPKLILLLLSGTKNLETVTFSGNMDSLEKIDLTFSEIKKLELSACPKLIDLNLSYKKNLETVTFLGEMESLATIELRNTGIKKLELSACPKLTRLDLSSADKLETLTFSGNMDSLEQIDLSNLSFPEIKTIELQSCPKLKRLDLSSTDELETLTFTGNMDSLEQIALSSLEIKKLELQSCPKLKELILSKAKNLETVTFSGNMDSLEQIDLESSAITALKLPPCPKLNSLNLRSIIELKSITFSGEMESLKKLLLSSSGIMKLKLPACPNLTMLDLGNTKGLESIVFTGPMPSLKRMSIVNSTVKEIIGIHFCPNLNTSKIPQDIIVEQSLLEEPFAQNYAAEPYQ